MRPADPLDSPDKPMRFVATLKNDRRYYLVVSPGHLAPELFSGFGERTNIAVLAQDRTQELLFALEDAQTPEDRIRALNKFTQLDWQVFKTDLG